MICLLSTPFPRAVSHSYVHFNIIAGGEGDEGDFTVVESSRTAVPRKQKCKFFSFSLISLVLHTKTNRVYNTTSTNTANATNNKTRNQQKKNATQYQRRNYDSLHIPSIPVHFVSLVHSRSNPLGNLFTKLNSVILLR